ncbi:MAG: FAD-dependent oxidoreductase [Deltaproteobacteria bacterium]|nr:FAD-dependent oxidoreductase [Deltaproteobacteria bacterium]
MRPAENFDVVVVGGGSAGVAAAVSSAELGARTLLLERGKSLGGNVAHAFVHTICGLYRAASEGDALVLNPGLPSRLAAGLCAAGVAAEPERVGRVYVLPIEPPRYAAFLAELCDQTAGLEVRTEATLTGAEPVAREGCCWSLRADEREMGSSEFTSSLLVDTTGDANAAVLAGAPVEAVGPEEIQLPSFIFRLGGVDRSDCVGFGKLRLTHAVAGAVVHGELPPGCESVLVRPGSEPDEVYLTLNVPRDVEIPYAPLDEKGVALLTARIREDAERIADYLRRTRPAFEKSRISAWPERIGVRETRRVRGLREIQGADVLAGRSDQDEVVRSSWPLELWNDHRRARFEYPEGVCSIPLGSLVSRSNQQLGMAGRCLSASHEALGALRVIGTALATGEAIGVAAALAADGGSPLEAISPADVRHHILERAEREIAL